MRASSSAAAAAAIQFPSLLSPLPTGFFSFTTTRTRICFSQQQRRLFFFFFSLKKSAAESRINGLHKFRVVPAAAAAAAAATTLTTQKQEEESVQVVVPPEVASTIEKEAVKNVLTLFLRKKCLTNEGEAATRRTISNKSDCFINHLVSRLHTIDKTRYLIGSELPVLALEITDTVVPYLESLFEEHGDNLVDVVENFPVSELRQSGILPPVTRYLLDIGMDVDQIKEVGRKYPSFADFSLEEHIKRAVEFLLDLGMPQSDIPSFLCKVPHCCGSDPIPTFLYLENLGLDKGQLLKMLKRYPRIFECKRHEVKRIVDFLHELGLSTKDIVKVIGTMYPKVVTYSVDDRLWPPVAEYFHSIGVNVPLLFFRYPMLFSFSVEQDIKPVTKILLDKGFSMEEIRIIAVKGGFYFLKVKKNFIPKWDFFLTMGYPRSDLVKFPQYFCYSLERNIKPRYELMMKRGVKLSLSQIFAANDSKFEKRMNRKVKRNKKHQDAKTATATTITKQQQDSFPPLLH